MEIILTPELVEICGIHAGDGYLRMRGGKIELEFGGSKEEKSYYDNHVIPLLNKAFELKLKGKFYSKGTYGFVTANNKFEILNRLGFPYGKKSKFVAVPKIILNSNNKLFYIKFLRGLFDTDGHLGFRKCYGKYSKFKRAHHHYPSIQLITISKKLAENTRRMLKKLNILHFIYVSNSIKSNENPSYRIIINGVSRVNKWMNLVGSKNPVKFSRYQIWEKFGFCPTNLTLRQREDILKGKLNIYKIGPVV